MADLLKTTINSCKQIIVLGDFKLQFDSSKETYAKSMRSSLSEYHLHQIIDKPTQNKGHIIDWLITPEDCSFIENLQVIAKAVSDHLVVTFSLNISKPEYKKKRSVTSRNIKSLNINAFNETLRSSLSIQLQDQNIVELYNECLTEALDHHAPLTTRTITCRSSATWYILDIKQAKQQKWAAERRWRKSNLTVHRQVYQQQVQHVKQLIVEEEKKYFNEKVSNCKNYKALFSVASEKKGTTNRNPFPTNTPTKD